MSEKGQPPIPVGPDNKPLVPESENQPANPTTIVSNKLREVMGAYGSQPFVDQSKMREVLVAVDRACSSESDLSRQGATAAFFSVNERGLVGGSEQESEAGEKAETVEVFYGAVGDGENWYIPPRGPAILLNPPHVNEKGLLTQSMGDHGKLDKDGVHATNPTVGKIDAEVGGYMLATSDGTRKALRKQLRATTEATGEELDELVAIKMAELVRGDKSDVSEESAENDNSQETLTNPAERLISAAGIDTGDNKAAFLVEVGEKNSDGSGHKLTEYRYIAQGVREEQLDEIVDHGNIKGVLDGHRDAKASQPKAPVPVGNAPVLTSKDTKSAGKAPIATGEEVAPPEWKQGRGNKKAESPDSDKGGFLKRFFGGGSNRSDKG